MIIPAIIFGMTFPMIIYFASRERDEGTVSGILYGINSFGSILGALSTSIILIPLFGVQRTLLFLPFLLIVFLFFTIRKKYQKIILIVFILIIIFYPRWQPQRMINNIFVTDKNILKFKKDVLFYKDSLYENVAVVKYYPNNLSLKLDGKADASYGDEATQKALGLLPFILKKNTDNVLVIGLGSGSTTSGCLQFPSVKSVETVEIEPAVVEAAHFFTKINKGVFSDTRSKIIVNDGRNYLLMHPEKKYDVITSEPSSPWLSGVSLLFTKEHFELVKEHSCMFIDLFRYTCFIIN
jgi:predicted membrane-bound spermidine synthase